MDLIIEELQSKIQSIKDEREAIENKYYADKRVLTAEYDTKTSLLLGHKIYLEKLLKYLFDSLIEKTENK